MASGDLYEVERIMDRRRSKKGKWEYLIRWKGYGSKEDTWEPEHHLLHCEDFIQQFHTLRPSHTATATAAAAAAAAAAHHHKRHKPPSKMSSGGGAAGAGAAAAAAGPRTHHHLLHLDSTTSRRRPSASATPSDPSSSRARAQEARKKRRTCGGGPAGVGGGGGVRVGVHHHGGPAGMTSVVGSSGAAAAAHKQRKSSGGGGGGGGGGKQATAADRMSKSMSYKKAPPPPPPPPARNLQFVPPLRTSPHNGLQNGEAAAAAPLMYGAAAAAAERSHHGLMPPSDRVERTLGHVVDTTGPQQHPTELGSSPLANGGSHVSSSTAKRKLAEDRGYMFDKRLRYNVRQSESTCRFRDIVVRKEDGFTHILLSSQTTDNNALTPEIMKEVCRALDNAAADDSKLLLLSAVGTVFCSGLEPSYLIGRLSTDRRKESSRISDAVRDFVLAFIHFKKPIVVAINGPAVGLGASILPLCDVVWASERAWFQTPCAALRLTPSGCSSYTFPQILGVALANEMLFCGRKLTAQEACSRGLVSQVFWPTTFNQEVMLRVKEMALCSAVVLEESKCLVRSMVMSVLEEVNEKECHMLKQLWCSTKGLEALFSYLHNKAYEK